VLGWILAGPREARAAIDAHLAVGDHDVPNARVGRGLIHGRLTGLGQPQQFDVHDLGVAHLAADDLLDWHIGQQDRRAGDLVIREDGHAIVCG